MTLYVTARDMRTPGCEPCRAVVEIDADGTLHELRLADYPHYPAISCERYKVVTVGTTLEVHFW